MDFEDEDVEEGIIACENRYDSRKNINRSALEAAFNNIWESPTGFKVEEIKPRFFQFFFQKKEDMLRIKNGGAWIFKTSLMILHEWRRGMKLDN